MDADEILARAEEALRRHGGMSRIAQRARRRKLRDARNRLGRIVLLLGGVLLAAFVWGLVIAPLGVTGVLLAALVFAIGAVALLFLPKNGWVPASELPQTELALLPLRTEEWLADHRKALPAPAQRLIDGIGIRLETLSDQLQTLDEAEPAALAVRRLVAHELPELVNGYARVPANLRKNGLNGINPDRQLIDGLGVVESELKRMSEQLAAGDLKALATQGRFLELKYEGDNSA